MNQKILISSIILVSAADLNNSEIGDSFSKSALYSDIDEKIGNLQGTFDLKGEINNAPALSVLYLDYSGHYGPKIDLSKGLTVDAQGYTLGCLDEKGFSAFYSNSENIVLKNIRINGKNDCGGAALIAGTSRYTLENCTFEINGTDGYDGVIYAETSSCFENNTAYKGKEGAVYTNKLCDDVKYASFIQNNAGDGTIVIDDVGAIYINNENTITFEICSFLNNNCSSFFCYVLSCSLCKLLYGGNLV